MIVAPPLPLTRQCPQDDIDFARLQVICINAAARENEDNRKLSKEAGLEDKIIIPGERSFFNTELPADSVGVVFSQDALLHAGLDRYKVLAEVARLLKPGELFVMSDVMQSEEATFEQVKEVGLGLKVHGRHL